MKRLIIAITMYASVLTAMAVQTDSALVEHHSLWRTTDADKRMNPALYGADYRYSMSELALALDTRNQSEAFVEEQGKGYILPSLGIDTWLRLSEKTAVWGGASYMTGTQRKVVWNSTSDYDILQPYILADTLGGDTRRERYAVSGGYASRWRQWLLGAEVLFRAEQEYRDRDPRMRGIVTDLTLRAGVARRFLDAYSIGAAIEGNIYKQTNSVAFYNEEGVIPEYQMTGLGTDYTRFSGDKRSIYYEGGGAALSVQLSPESSKGVYGALHFDEHRYHRHLSDYNSMPLTDLYIERVRATFGWKREASSRLAVYGRFDYTRRTGDERVVGTSDGNAYPTVASLTMYKNRLTDVSVGAVYGRAMWNLSLCGGWQDVAESYAWPERRLDYSRAYGRLQGQLFVRVAAQWLLTFDAHAAYTANLDGTTVMPYANMDAKMTEMVNHKRDYAQASYTDLGAVARADYAWRNSRYGLFAEVGGGTVLCSTKHHQTDFHVSLGVTF